MATCGCQSVKINAKGVHESIGSATVSFVMVDLLRYQYSLFMHPPCIYWLPISLSGETIQWLIRYFSLHPATEVFHAASQCVPRLWPAADERVSGSSLVIPRPLVALVVFGLMERPTIM